MAQLIKGVVDTQKNSYRSIGQVNAADDLELELEVKMNGQPIEFINPECELLIKKSDNNKVRQTKDIIYKDGKFKIKVDEQGVTYPGIVTCQLVTKEDGRVSTCLFYFNVGTSLDREVLQSISKVETLEQLDEYVATAFANLDEYEKRIIVGDETIRKLNNDMSEAEKIRDAAELERQETFKTLKENMNEAITNLESSINLSNLNEKERSEVFNALKSNLESIKQDLINLNTNVESEEEKRVQAEIDRVNKTLEIIGKLESTNDKVTIAEAERVTEFNNIKSELTSLKEALTTINNIANSNEEIRKTNENGRVAAEQQRVIDFEKIKSDNTNLGTTLTKKVDDKLTEIQKDNTTFKQEINEQYEDIVTEFDKVIANVTNGNENATNSEIVQARGKEVNLNARLDNFDEQLDKIETNVELNYAKKDDVAKISSGTPLFASSTSEMIDTTKNYVNTTDGYLYIYSNGQWSKTTVQYQSTGISDESVTYNNLTNNVHNSINVGEYIIEYNWEQGSITSEGINTTSGKRLRTSGYNSTKNNEAISVTQGYRYALFFYDESKTKVDYVGWRTTDYVIDSTYPYYRILLSNVVSTADITKAEGVNIISKCKTELNKRILVLENNENSKYPSFFETEINDTVTKVRNSITDKNLSFMFLSDSHLNPKDNDNVEVWNNTVLMMKEMSNRCYFDFLAHTGDIVEQTYVTTNGATDGEVFDCITKCILDMKGITNKLLVTNGNHDGASANNYGNKQWYYYCGGRINDDYVSRGYEGASFYVDYPNIKTRCIFCSLPDSNPRNTYYWGYSEEQLKWLQDDALQTEDGYGILIFMHSPETTMYNSKEMGHRDSFDGMINAYHKHTNYTDSLVNVDFTNKTSTKAIAVLCGHVHGDYVVNVGETSTRGVVNNLPCKIITIGASKFTDTTSAIDYNYTVPSRNMNDHTQVLFDCVVYVPSENKIKITRFGAGADREIVIN